MPSSEVIVIGSGPNGLACATRLAQKGTKVLLLDALPTSGGGVASREFAPGFHTCLAHLTRGIDARVTRGMDLERHGLRFHPALATTLLGPNPLTLNRGKTDSQDSEFAQLHNRLTHFARVLAPFRHLTAPRFGKGNNWITLARLGLGFRTLGRKEFREFLRLLLINAADVAEDELTDTRLQAYLAFEATLGAWAGPRSPNTLILLLNHLAIGPDPLLPKGGMAAVAAAMTKAATCAGVTVRQGAKVTRILTDGDRATGVELASGQVLTAQKIVSTLHPGLTLRDLIGPKALDAGLYARAGHIHSRGGTARLTLALKGLAKLDNPSNRMIIAPSVKAVENAFNPVKYGEVPKVPVMELVIPTAHDPRPDGQHILTANVQFAPHDPVAGLEAARAEMLENSLTVLEAHFPGLRAQILHAELLMPQDVAAIYGNPGGNWHHAELAVEQMLFLRPLHDLAQYRTPIEGLWLAGAGSHPGGGITGAAGWNAALAMEAAP
ncbi:MAG: phytoene desaturase family protein [Cypionkella sp.]